jgi:hypothetical protein
MSIQGRRRIGETIRLRINGCLIEGEGTDADGQFHLQGTYDPATQHVTITRRYSWTNEPNGLSVNIPFDYTGEWNGMMVSGVWRMRADPLERGPFEMWPNRDEDRLELAIELEEGKLLAGTIKS